ncbi:MAG: DnaA regulatory inactivator Hda [Ectothiorhodospiraceae bacterium]
MNPQTPSRPVQLPLGIRWDDTARLATFHAGSNARALASVEALLRGDEAVLYLHGPASSGKSHLLQAAARACGETGAPVAYLPLAEPAVTGPAVLEGMEGMALVAVDDLHAVAGDRDWEEALFHTFNRLRDAGTALCFAANGRPDAVGLCLPDLVSRLRGGLVERLQRMDDDDKLAALRHRAGVRGLHLPDEVGWYLLRHQPRDPARLFRLLEVLDEAALAEKRRLTVPFVRQVLARQEPG